MSDSPTPETDEARMKGYGEFGGDWCPLERNCYEKHPEGDVVFCEVARKLERERDEARIEWKEAWEGWNQALDERDQSRRDMVAAEELHSRRFGSLKAEFEQVMRERDEARKELEEALQRLSLWEGAVMRMKKQLSFAPPFRTEEAK